MRRILTQLAVATLASAALLTASAGAASASVSVSAPSCESGANTIACDVTSSPPAGTTITWTIYSVWVYPNPYSLTGSNSLDLRGCHSGGGYAFSYSYTSGGVNYVSLRRSIACNSGPWP